MVALLRKIIIFEFVGLAALVLIVAAAIPLASAPIEKRLNQRLQKACETCRVSFRSVYLSGLGISFKDFEFHGGNAKVQSVRVRMPSLKLTIHVWRWLKDEPMWLAIRLDRPAVHFDDLSDSQPKSDAHSDSEPASQDGSMIASMHVVFSEGSFTYLREVEGTHAELAFTGLSGAVSPLKTGWGGTIKGRMGASGNFQLSVEVPSLSQPLRINTEAHIEQQNLADLSKFFEPNAGVVLKGTLMRGHAITHLVDREVNASLAATYKDFDLKVIKMYDRSPLQAFFINLGASIAMQSKNTGAEPEDKVKSAKIHREVDESIVSFILRGLKEAAIAVAM